MKAILEFNLPEEQVDFEAAAQGMQWKRVVWDFDQMLRNRLKYGKDCPSTSEALERVRAEFRQFIYDKGLVIE